MWEKGTPRGKTRRASPPDASLTPASDSTTAAADSSWHETTFPLAGGGEGGEPVPQRSASELLALHRRCFSCCNAVLQQQACLVGSDERVMLRQQTGFTDYPLMKTIMARVSEQRYTDVKEFFDDFTELVNSCITGVDRREVLEALSDQLVVTDGAESKRHIKATFQGFPHPLVEEMMSHASSARKKIPPGGTVHVTVDVGRFLARAYGHGLSAGARFCGEPSQEKAFFAQRRKREIEQANLVGTKVSVAALKAQKKNKAKEKNAAEGPKKRQKLQPLGTPTPAVATPAIPKVNRSLRATRRMTADDSTDDLQRPSAGTPDLHRPSSNVSNVSNASNVSDVSNASNVSNVSNSHVPERRVFHRRVCKREKVHCHHLQGHNIEMEDLDYTGFRFTGTLQGTTVACHCGCDRTLPARTWLMHNGGRAKSRHPLYPWRYMRLLESKTKLVDHFRVCDCHEHLCDTCRSWEAPGAPMVSCRRCRTSIHATEECAIQVAPHEDGPGPTALGSPVGTAQEAYGAAAAAAVAPEAQGAMPHISASASGKQGASGVNDASSLAVRRSASMDETTDGLLPSSLAVASRSRTCRRKDTAEAKADAAGPGSPDASAGDEPFIVSDSRPEDNASDIAWICQICSGGGAEYVSGSIDQQ